MFHIPGQTAQADKVMAKGIDPTCTNDTIGEYLASKQFAIKDVVHMQIKK